MRGIIWIVGALLLVTLFMAIAVRLAGGRALHIGARSITGTLDDVDLTSREIVVTASGVVRRVILPASVRIHKGAQMLTVEELALYTHQRIKVWMDELGPEPVASDISVAARAGT